MSNLEMNQAQSLDPTTEQLVHKIVSALLKPAEKGECRCHWLDPTKTPILAWKSAKDPNTLVLKISQQKFIGLTRSDKNNEMYWKFRDFYEGGAETPVPSPVPIKKEVEVPPLKPETEPANFPSSSAIEETEAVKKFREKYGTPSNPKVSEQ
ncbi:MAG: hypothetical protein I3270_02600 [Candidatus Moeniiplasma glomeromycotorum]|nr:hypothetical protein [Candidatus Moeniiplasma glomeromycotorum]MCE8162563.1 hypothetical protein [Candidatus Moeniiplasma glomeromycotorum]MCE8166513.1 hypothetical protein [Candidatus Moeniiplasma glomeromycotorum]MCE8166946.1 hypothetical protein [Candidatus Moeniiplasma glomeromycotorum]